MTAYIRYLVYGGDNSSKLRKKGAANFSSSRSSQNILLSVQIQEFDDAQDEDTCQAKIQC
jgi:hypothetical protein